MKELTENEILEVNGALSPNLSFVIDKALGFGALGVLGNMLLHGTNAAAGWHGFLVGAGVGTGYASIKLLIS